MTLQSLFERKRYSELRRRIIRGAMRPIFHAGDSRLTRATDLSAASVRRILVCRPNHRLGNLVLLTPLVIELQRTFPQARIDIVLAGEHGAELFRTFRQVGHVYSLSRRMVRHPIAIVRTTLQMRRAHYDLVLDPCEASQSGRLLATIAGARQVIGIPRGRSIAGLAQPASMDRVPAHMAQWPIYLLRRTLTHSTPGSGNDFPALDIQLSADERENARTTLEQTLRAAGESRTRHVIGVFAEATGAKGYGSDWWRRFIRVVAARHPAVAIVEIVPADGRPRLAGELPSFGSPSPRAVAAVISNMQCFVSADCGIMHLASAAGVPTIGLFSVTDALKYAPYGHGSQALETNGKSPEQVAESASTLMETFCADTSSGPCAHPHDDPAAAANHRRDHSAAGMSGSPTRT